MKSVKNIYIQQFNKDLQERVEFWGYVIPLLERIQRDGASFFIKLDGEREESVYTMMIEGGPLKDVFIRHDTDDIEEGINQVISEYANQMWR